MLSNVASIMDQKLQSMFDFGASVHPNLNSDFAYQLFVIGLENKDYFFDQDFDNSNHIPSTIEKEKGVSRLFDKLILRTRRRKKRSKKCNFFL